MDHPALDVVDDAVDRALAEDLARGDVTSAILPAEHRARGVIVARSGGVVCGMDVARRVFAKVDASVRFEALAKDGDRVEAGATLARVEGATRSLLGAERTALNFLGRLSGIATLTAAYVEAARSERSERTRARISDTRKTTPGLRALEKYAVRCGGGVSHRMDLAEAVLLKDNHVRALGGVGEAVRRAKRACARASAPAGMRVEVEVATLAELDQALAAGATDVLLDNMDDATVREAVQRAKRACVAGRAVVEASGGVTLERVRALAEAGVDVISVGRLTHSAPAADVSFEIE